MQFLIKYVFLYIIFIYSNIATGQIPDIENRDKTKVKKGISDSFIRSMNKWDIPFNDLLENRSGAACINWKLLTEDFIENGIFDALGYSQNIPNKKASEIAAISGCKKMKVYYKLGNTCSCEVIITNDDTVVKIPIKKFNKEKEFKDAVNLYENKEYKDSYKKFLILSEKGDSKSQYNLAVIIFKGEGFTQNFKKAYYWSLMSKLGGQKKAEKLIKNSRKRLKKEEVIETSELVREDLEKLANEGKMFALVPLAKWYLVIPKEPDYNNSYKWLTIAAAFDIINTKKARERIFKKVNKKDLTEIQEDSNNIYTSIVSKIKANQNGEAK